ncbi:MAG: nucleotidyl transferase AbiEii/AbiGii toxin family protein [Bacilli bacterium]|nr:nucleotidyl transferase AbiEii/AbiGii toxin family protein [Bacilli bacterium]
MECFLGRLSHSSYRDSFVLKGGVLVGALFGATLRSTMDIDQTIKGIPLKNRKLN